MGRLGAKPRGLPLPPSVASGGPSNPRAPPPRIPTLPGRYSPRLVPHLLEQVGALLVAGNHVEQAVAVDVADVELRADARVAVDDPRHERGLAVFLLAGL